MGDQAHERISAEQLPLSLRGLFEQRGYRRYRMSNFETYDFYRENKNFLESEGIITFTDTSGRLMALKPDVTMSIVKHTKPDTVSSRLYYEENVFRIDPQSGEYREISQVGLEYIGGQPGYGEAEVVELAARSLRLMGEETVLDIGHMGFVAGLSRLGCPRRRAPTHGKRCAAKTGRRCTRRLCATAARRTTPGSWPRWPRWRGRSRKR